VIEAIGTQRVEKEVGTPVVVVVSDGDSDPVGLDGEPRARRDVLEGPVARLR
jgi:hypothetical protein